MSNIFNNRTSLTNEQSEQFIQLFMKHQREIYAHILIMIPNYSQADDILQETATVLWYKFADFEIGTNFAAWGKRIAFNIVRDYFKKQRSARQLLNEDHLKEVIDRLANNLEHLDYRMEALQSCMKKISEKDRKIIQLRYENGLSVPQISKHVKRPIQGLYKAMARIHESLLVCVKKNIASEYHL